MRHGSPASPIRAAPDSAIPFPRVTSAGLSSLVQRSGPQMPLGLLELSAQRAGQRLLPGPVTPGGSARGGAGAPSPLRHPHREPRPPVPAHSRAESRPGCSRRRHLAAAACQLLPQGWERCPPCRRLARGSRSLSRRPAGCGAGMRREGRRARSPGGGAGLSAAMPHLG